MTSSAPTRAAPLLEVTDLAKRFTLKGTRTVLRAVDGVSFTLARGDTLGIVGESGCGKSTLGRLLLRLIEPTEGSVRFMGREVTLLPAEPLRQMRRHMQMVFQDPLASLDPRLRIGALLEEPLVIHGIGTPAERRAAVAELLTTVGLPADAAQRFPHEFSGGQRQRICIARALALSPELIVADEPVSALDVSIQSQILNLLGDLKRSRGLTYVFISHNLAVVKYVSDVVAVMYLGRIVETGRAEDVFARPLHPYTQALLAAIPEPDPTRARAAGPALSGELPAPDRMPDGCRFHPRCPHATDRCRTEAPRPVSVARGDAGVAHVVECHLHG
ncbi:MAG: ATP-binding cassette domain-containing protein [Burkholderiales bacterium]|nr:ATP-binding cassette domain-containing protein [Burkholderiales bacterium]